MQPLIFLLGLTIFFIGVAKVVRMGKGEEYYRDTERMLNENARKKNNYK
jgi:hypothetical protein